MIRVKIFVQEQQGMVSLSALLILSVLMMVSVYLYDILQFQISSLQNFKLRVEAQNYTYDCANMIIKKYKEDYSLWRQNIIAAERDFNISDAKIVGEFSKQGAFGEQTAKVYLMHYHDDFYILIVEVHVQDVVNQMSIHLQNNEKEGSFYVYRYEP